MYTNSFTHVGGGYPHIKEGGTAAKKVIITCTTRERERRGHQSLGGRRNFCKETSFLVDTVQCIPGMCPQGIDAFLNAFATSLKI